MTIAKFKKLKEGTKIYFKGVEFEIPWDVGTVNSNSIPLCTKEQYENFNISYGHIYFNATKSEVMRYHTQIGTIKDISSVLNEGGVDG